MKTEKKQKGIGLGTGMIIGIAIIYILFGLAIEFVPQFKEIYIIYIAGAIFVVFDYYDCKIFPDRKLS